MIRVLIADDHAIIREGIRKVLSGNPRIETIAEAADGHAALDALRQGKFDLAIVDLAMPGRSGIDLIKQIRADFPDVAVLVLSMYKEEQFAVRAIRAGASGYLSKECAGSELLTAVSRILGGRLYISPTVAECLALDARPEESAPHTRLTDREFQILGLLVRGDPVTRIANTLNLSVKTVSTHKSRILEKLGLDSAADLVRYCMQHGLDQSNRPPD